MKKILKQIGIILLVLVLVLVILIWLILAYFWWYKLYDDHLAYSRGIWLCQRQDDEYCIQRWNVFFWFSKFIDFNLKRNSISRSLRVAGFNGRGKGITGKDFILLSTHYARDKYNIYFHQDKIKGVDLDSFRIIDSSYSRDKDSVYLFIWRIEGVDPESFEIITQYSLWSYDNFYSKDKNHVYINWKIIKGADVDSFVVWKNWLGKDKNHTYNIFWKKEIN